MLIKYIANPIYILENIDWMPLTFADQVLMQTTACTKRVPPSTTLFTGSCSLHHPANNLYFDGINHWITKGLQRRCPLREYIGTWVYYCKRCNVGLHSECFKSYHCT